MCALARLENDWLFSIVWDLDRDLLASFDSSAQASRHVNPVLHRSCHLETACKEAAGGGGE